MYHVSAHGVDERMINVMYIIIIIVMYIIIIIRTKHNMPSFFQTLDTKRTHQKSLIKSE